MTHPDNLPFDVLLNELADTYETLVALPPTPPDTGGRRPGKPGSKVPPGVNEILDVEEYETVIAEVDSWALYIAHHLLDVEPGIGRIPDTTPARLRLAARWTDKLEGEPDLYVRYAIRLDGSDHLRAVRRLVRQRNRVVRTGSPCLDITCKGTYKAVIEGPDADDNLRCDRCGDLVPYEQWHRWGARSEWVTAIHAADMLGVPVSTVRVWAHRYEWRREGTGRDVRYRTEDVENKRSKDGVSVA